MILDESVWGEVLNPSQTGWSILRQSLEGKRSASQENHKLHVGGAYWNRAARGNGPFKNFLVVLNAGLRLVIVDSNAVDESETRWQGVKELCCDTDHWVLALSEVGRTKFLASNDEGLKEDFRRRRGGTVLCRGNAADRVRTERILREAK